MEGIPQSPTLGSLEERKASYRDKSLPRVLKRRKSETAVAVESELPTSGPRPSHQGMPNTQRSSRRLVPGFSALWGVMTSPVGAEFAEAPALES